MSTENAVSTPLDPNDKIMAALAHISALLPLMGVIAPIIIWVTQKDKSQYVAFQALQAVVYQLLRILAWIVGMGCYMFSAFGIFFTIPFVSEGSGSSSSPLFFLPILLPFLILGLMFLGGFAFIIYGVIGAIQAFRGKNFRYILIGNRLEQYLQRNG
jgi:uncharacterized Tic20 family protein